MCKQCESKPVYEFTNKRKLCKRCFIIYFQKKVLYTIRKFNMLHKTKVIGYASENIFRDVVLSNILEFISEKSNLKIIKPNKKTDKIAVSSSLDLEAEEILNILIQGKIRNLECCLPVVENFIKPLYLFLDKEILLYATLKDLKFKKIKKKGNKITKFLNETEKKHPEVKRAIVNSLLKMYNF